MEKDKETHTRARKLHRQGQSYTKEEKAEIQAQFLTAFTACANFTQACLDIGINRPTVYKWIENDKHFSALYDDAEKMVNDKIRAEIWRRGVDGYDKPVVNHGKVVYVEDVDEDGNPTKKMLMERVYSDNLLSLLARSRMPEFRDKQSVEHSGSLDVNGASDSLFQKLAATMQAQNKSEDPKK